MNSLDSTGTILFFGLDVGGARWRTELSQSARPRCRCRRRCGHPGGAQQGENSIWAGGGWSRRWVRYHKARQRLPHGPCPVVFALLHLTPRPGRLFFSFVPFPSGKCVASEGRDDRRGTNVNVNVNVVVADARTIAHRHNAFPRAHVVKRTSSYADAHAGAEIIAILAGRAGWVCRVAESGAAGLARARGELVTIDAGGAGHTLVDERAGVANVSGDRHRRTEELVAHRVARVPALAILKDRLALAETKGEHPRVGHRARVAGGTHGCGGRARAKPDARSAPAHRADLAVVHPGRRPELRRARFADPDRLGRDGKTGRCVPRRPVRNVSVALETVLAILIPQAALELVPDVRHPGIERAPRRIPIRRNRPVRLRRWSPPNRSTPRPPPPPIRRYRSSPRRPRQPRYPSSGRPPRPPTTPASRPRPRTQAQAAEPRSNTPRQGPRPATTSTAPCTTRVPGARGADHFFFPVALWRGRRIP